MQTPMNRARASQRTIGCPIAFDGRNSFFTVDQAFERPELELYCPVCGARVVRVLASRAGRRRHMRHKGTRCNGLPHIEGQTWQHWWAKAFIIDFAAIYLPRAATNECPTGECRGLDCKPFDSAFMEIRSENYQPDLIVTIGDVTVVVEVVVSHPPSHEKVAAMSEADRVLMVVKLDQTTISSAPQLRIAIRDKGNWKCLADPVGIRKRVRMFHERIDASNQEIGLILEALASLDAERVASEKTLHEKSEYSKTGLLYDELGDPLRSSCFRVPSAVWQSEVLQKFRSMFVEYEGAYRLLPVGQRPRLIVCEKIIAAHLASSDMVHPSLIDPSATSLMRLTHRQNRYITPNVWYGEHPCDFRDVEFARFELHLYFERLAYSHFLSPTDPYLGVRRTKEWVPTKKLFDALRI